MDSTDKSDLERLFATLRVRWDSSPVQENSAPHPDQLALPGLGHGPKDYKGSGDPGSEEPWPVREARAGSDTLSRLELILGAYAGACEAARPHLHRAITEVSRCEGVTIRDYISAYVILGMGREQNR